MMAYYFPIVLNENLNSNLLTGLLIGGANLAALACDFLIPKYFKKYSWRFLIITAILIQMLYPLNVHIGIFFSFSFTFIIAAIFWNVYFEFFAFARHNYIITNEKKENYSKAWGIITIFVNVAGVMGPILGSYLLNLQLFNRQILVSSIQVFVLILTGLLIFLSPKNSITQELKPMKTNFLKEINIYKVIYTKIFPVVLLGMMVSMISSSVLTVGGLLGEQMFGAQKLDWLIIFIFSIPSILVSFILIKLKIQRRKKRISQILLFIAAISLISMYFFQSYPIVILILFFLCSTGISAGWILNESVFSELSKRSDGNALYTNGLERIDDSLGFLIGPILIGLLSDRFGYFSAFTILGILSLVLAIFLIVITPRKLRMPKREIKKIEVTYDDGQNM
jgi:MFS family permease